MVLHVACRRNYFVRRAKRIGHYLLHLSENVSSKVYFQRGLRLVQVCLVVAKRQFIAQLESPILLGLFLYGIVGQMD